MKFLPTSVNEKAIYGAEIKNLPIGADKKKLCLDPKVWTQELCTLVDQKV